MVFKVQLTKIYPGERIPAILGNANPSAYEYGVYAYQNFIDGNPFLDSDIDRQVSFWEGWNAADLEDDAKDKLATEQKSTI